MTNPKIKKVVIFAGGEGTRLSEETGLVPKPLVKVGDDAIVVHIMRHFYRQGYREFILAVGYKSEQFKNYFRDYAYRGRSVSFSSRFGENIHGSPDEDWIVHVVETGPDATTGQRLDAVRKYIGDDDFFLTYGDSHSDVNLAAVEAAHEANENAVATITAVSRAERFGILELSEDGNGHGMVTSFVEKSVGRDQLINGGFIACSNELLDFVDEDADDFAYGALSQLSAAGRLGYYHHTGFWKAMDTKRDLDQMNELYQEKPELF